MSMLNVVVVVVELDELFPFVELVEPFVELLVPDELDVELDVVILRNSSSAR